MEIHTKNLNENAENSKRKLNKTILDNFSNLLKDQESVRIKSSINILKYLSDNTEKENEISYALGRIIRGLGSSSVSARTGFYTILVAVVNFNENISLDEIVVLIDKELHKSGSNTKSENADIATGQILACGAIVRSRLWIMSSQEQKEKILSIIIKASKERVYLSLLANTFIISSVENLPEKKFQKLFPLIKEVIAKPWEEQTLDSLYLLNGIINKYPATVTHSFLLEYLGSEMISEDSLGKLCDILLTIPRMDSLKHPFYSSVSKEIASHELFRDFTRHLDNLLSTRNRNKLLAVLKIYTYVLQSIRKTSHVPHLLSKNFIQYTLNYSKNVKNDNEFQESVRNFFDMLLTTLRKDGVKSKTKISVLKKLLFFPGTFIFEKITKSKIVQHITASLDNEGVKNLATLYRGVVAGTERIDSQDEHWLNNDRLYAAHLLVKLMNLSSVKEENDWKIEQLNFLMNLGLFKCESEINVGGELASYLKSTFYGALDLKLSKLDDLVYIMSKLFNNLNSRINIDNLQTILRNPIDEDTYAIWQKTAKKVSKIENKRKKNSVLKTVFLTLFLQMGLQLHNDAKLASNSLDELFACYEKSRKTRRESTSSLTDTTEDQSKIENDQTDNDPLWIEVVVDLFLNLLSHNSHLLRHLVNCVFPHLCQYMTPAALHQILTVLADPEKADNLLSNNNSHSSDEDESEGEAEEKAVNEIEEGESRSEESDSEIENPDDDDKETVNEKLRIALQEALSKNGGYQTDEESIDIDNMSETEGKELDKALASAFRLYTPNRGKPKKQSKDEETLTHFRIRVIDLIETYINSTPPMHLSLEIMLPLLQAVEFSIRDAHQLPLHNRLKSCLKKLTNLKKFSETEEVTESQLNVLLKSLLEKGTKTTWIVQDMRVEIAQCCTFVIRCSDILGSESKKKDRNYIPQIILQELDTYFHKRDSHTPIVLFKNIMGLSWDGCLSLIPALFSYVFKNEVKPFKRNQSVELLKIFYQNRRFFNVNGEKINNALESLHEQFSENVVNFFNSLCNNPNDRNVKEKYVCSIFNLLAVIKSSSLKIDNINWTKIGEVIRKYRSYVTFSKDAKTAFNKLCNRLGISNIVKMNKETPKLNPVSEHNDANPDNGILKKKNKKTKNMEKLKLKKVAKQMRLQSLSEGLNSMDFTEMNDVYTENDNKVEESNVSVSDFDTQTDTDKNSNTNREQKKVKRKIDQMNGILDSPIGKLKKHKL